MLMLFTLFPWNRDVSRTLRIISNSFLFPSFVLDYVIALLVSTVKMWVLIFLWRFCERYEPCTFMWKALFQACLIKRAFSWKCIGRQPDSEGSLSRAVHGVCHYFTGIFHLLSHSIFLVWPHFYDKSLEKYKPDNLWSNLLLKVIFLQKTHCFLSAQ